MHATRAVFTIGSTSSIKTKIIASLHLGELMGYGLFNKVCITPSTYKYRLLCAYLKLRIILVPSLPCPPPSLPLYQVTKSYLPVKFLDSNQTEQERLPLVTVTSFFPDKEDLFGQCLNVHVCRMLVSLHTAKDAAKRLFVSRPSIQYCWPPL